MIHIRDAKAAGFEIDMSAAGRPLAYKGPRFNMTSYHECFTVIETGLIDALRLAVESQKLEPATPWVHEQQRAAIADAERLIARLDSRTVKLL